MSVYLGAGSYMHKSTHLTGSTSCRVSKGWGIIWCNSVSLLLLFFKQRSKQKSDISIKSESECSRIFRI